MIRVTGLRKRFDALNVLNGVDLSLAAGRVTALVGPNGSGKTTLIKSLLGLIRPDDGQIELDGERLNGDASYRRRIGYMPQLPRFPENLTGREVIDLIATMRGNDRRDPSLLREFALEASLDKPVRSLSGGTRQRINAVCAFLFDPDVLILDEPTAGLDPLASAILKDYVRASRDRGRTVLVTSHVMAELEELADDVAFLIEGVVRFSGPIAELRMRTGERTLERAIASLMRGPTRADPEIAQIAAATAAGSPLCIPALEAAS